MKESAFMKKAAAWADAARGPLGRFAGAVRRAMTLNLAEGILLPKKVLCVALEPGGASVALGTRFLSRIEFKGFRRLSYEGGKPPPPESLAADVSLALREMKAPRAEVALSFPKAWTVLQTADLPATVKENLPRVVSYELDRLTPFSASDAFYDFSVLKEAGGRVRIAVVAARADTAQGYLRAFGDRGMPVGRLTSNLAGLGTLCAYMGMGEDALFASVADGGYRGCVMSEGRPVSAFDGDAEPSGDGPLVDAFVGEINALLEEMKKEGKSPEVLLDIDDGRRSLLGERLAAPVRVLKYSDLKLALPGAADGIPHAAVGGALEALWPKAKPLNLLERGFPVTSKTPGRITAALLACACTLGVLFLASPLKIEEQRIAEIDRQIALRKEEVKKVDAVKREIDRLNREIAAVSSFKKGKPPVLDVLKELTAIIPQNAWLTRVRVAGANVDLEGYAVSAADILTKLESSDYFHKVEYGASTFRDTRLNAERFVIKMELEPAPAGAKEKP